MTVPGTSHPMVPLVPVTQGAISDALAREFSTAKGTNSGFEQIFPSATFIPIHLNAEVWDTDGMRTALTATITAVNIGLQKITVSGDITSGIVAGKPFSITGSTGNDNIYRATSVTLVGSDTEIVVGSEQPLVSAVADGTMNYQLNRITIPDDGLYWISARIHFYANTTGIRGIWIVVNGSQFRIAPRWTVGLSVETAVQNDGSLELNAGDYVEAWAYQQTTPAVNLRTFAFGESRTWLQVLRQREKP